MKIKIAISSTGNEPDSNVDPRFGRCPFYVIVDIEDKEIKDQKTIDNPATTQGGGAGISAAQLVANEKAEAVITGNMGPNAFSVLDQAGIKIYIGTGPVKEAIQQFIEGTLNEVNSPTAGPGIGKNRG